MPGNIITIEFNEDLQNTGSLTLSGLTTYLLTNTPFSYTWSWVSLRSASFQVTTGTPTITPGERSAINFVTAFNLDVNGTNLYSVARVANVVTITAVSSTVMGITFTDALAWKTTTPPVFGNVEFTYGAVNTSNLTIETIEFLPDNSNRCGNVSVHVVANQVITEVLSPVMSTPIPPPNSDEFTFIYPRGVNATLTVKNGQGVTVSEGFQTPPILGDKNIFTQVNNSPNGATLVVSVDNSVGLTLQYAVTPPDTSPFAYQSSNVFTGIAPGSYWMHVRDQFGCSKYYPFIVDEIQSTRTPLFYISKAMSLRFAERIDFSLPGNYKTDENTLSCEVDVKKVYKEVQQFQTNDIITTQFKSNYTNNVATIIRESGATVNVPVIRKSNNIGVKDKRDATQINLGNGKLGIYFESGNTYNYDTNVVTGTYALNGGLPYWATLGNYFSVGLTWYEVDEIYYDEDLAVDVIVVDAPYTGEPITVIVGSIYNVFPYEVYEFTIDFGNYPNENIQVRISCSDSEFTTKTLLSETINVKEKQKGTVEIRYSNPQNTDVFYSTGIFNLIRMPINKVGGSPDQENENYKTDSTTILLSSEVYEVTQFIFEPVTREIMRKMVQAFNHKTLTMDGVAYVINGSVETEGPLEQSNLWVVTVNLIKTGGAFNSNIQGDNELFDPLNIEVPGLIDLGDGNFVKY